MGFEPFVLATGNPHKAREMAEILGARVGLTLAAAPLAALDGATVGFVCAASADLDAAVAAIHRPATAPDVAETGTTLEANARIKARAVAVALGVPAAADDTGLEVDALGGDPGVHSARYAGEPADDARNRERLLREMRERLRASRTARFRTVVLHHDPRTEREIVAVGKIEGVIVDDPRGDGGFGYDPVFAPVGGGGRTFAELSAAEKHRISHRGRAVRALAERLAEEA